MASERTHQDYVLVPREPRVTTKLRGRAVLVASLQNDLKTKSEVAADVYREMVKHAAATKPATESSSECSTENAGYVNPSPPGVGEAPAPGEPDIPN